MSALSSVARAGTALVLAFAALTACSASGKDAPISATKLGQLIPVKDRVAAHDVGGPLLVGHGSTTLAAYRGHPVIVDFWASWCGPCTVETPQINAMYQTGHASGLRAVGFDTKDIGSGGTTFVRQHHLTMPMVYDEPGKALLQIGNVPAKDLPVVILIDKHQRIAAVYTQAFEPADIRPALAKLAAES